MRRQPAGHVEALVAFLPDAADEALQEEILDRIGAIQALSETIATAQLEAPDSRSHGGILDALAILSRDVRGLMEASFQPGP